MPAEGSIRRAASFITCAASDWSVIPSDIGNIVVGSNNGVPIRVKDIGDVVIGHAPRLGEFGFQKNDDAVEGVILMLRGEQTQNVLKGVEAKTEELNRQHPAARRQDSSLLRSQRTGEADHRYGGRQPAARHGAGADRPDFLPGQFSCGHHCRAHHSACPFCLPSSCCMPTMSPPTCFPLAQSISASSSTAPS